MQSQPAFSKCRRCNRQGRRTKELTDAWTWEYFPTAAEKCELDILFEAVDSRAGRQRAPALGVQNRHPVPLILPRYSQARLVLPYFSTSGNTTSSTGSKL
jgi:hypothetical protein